MPRLANNRLIACWIVWFECDARITADVESGNRNRQNRDASNGVVGELSFTKTKAKLLIFSSSSYNSEFFFIGILLS